MPYTSAMDGLAMRTLLFFLDNPDESLTGPDIRVKFGVRSQNLGQALGPLVERGVLSHDGGKGGRPSVFSAGPKLRPLGAECKTQA